MLGRTKATSILVYAWCSLVFASDSFSVPIEHESPSFVFPASDTSKTVFPAPDSPYTDFPFLDPSRNVYVAPKDPLHPVTESSWERDLNPPDAAWQEAHSFAAEPPERTKVRGEYVTKGGVEGVSAVIRGQNRFIPIARPPLQLPPPSYDDELVYPDKAIKGDWEPPYKLGRQYLAVKLGGTNRDFRVLAAAKQVRAPFFAQDKGGKIWFYYPVKFSAKDVWIATNKLAKNDLGLLNRLYGTKEPIWTRMAEGVKSVLGRAKGSFTRMFRSF